MKPEDVEKILKIPPIAVYHYAGRVAEDLGSHDVDTDRFRITLHQPYPSIISWAMNQVSTMDIVCLQGTVNLFVVDDSSFIQLTPCTEVTISNGRKYRWQPVTKDVVLLIMCTPYFSHDQHCEIFDQDLSTGE